MISVSSRPSWISKLCRPLAAAVTLSGLALLGLGSAPRAAAADVAWTVNYTLSLNSSAYVDMVSGTISTTWTAETDFYIDNFTYPNDGPNITQIALPGYGVIYDFMDAVNLALGDEVDASDPYWGSAQLGQKLFNSPATSPFPQEETGYVGVNFGIEGQVHYGWVSLVRLEDSNLFTITGFGYNDTPGAASTVGAVPEPSTAALLLLLGSGALLFVRSRRTA